MTLTIVMGVDARGEATQTWRALLNKRLQPAEYQAIAAVRRPLSADEEAWAWLIEARSAEWQKIVEPIVRLYEPVPAPNEVQIVLGNRGAADAFTHDGRTIGFDLAQLQTN